MYDYSSAKAGSFIEALNVSSAVVVGCFGRFGTENEVSIHGLFSGFFGEWTFVES